MGESPLTLLRGYPPVLGAMLLVDGVLTVILGGDATVSLGEVVAYLLLPPLAMYLLTRFTGGRRLSGVTIGIGVAGAAVILAALFLGGGVDLLTLPAWLLAVVGLLLLGAAVVLMRRGAPAPAVAPRSASTERDGLAADPPDDGYVDPPRPMPSAEFGVPSGDYGRAAEPEWPSHREPLDAGPTWSAHDEAQPGYPVGAQQSWSDGPSDRQWPPAPAEREWPPMSAAPEWPPSRDPEPAPDAGTQRSWFEADEARPEQPERDWPDRDWPPSAGRRSRHPDQ